MYRTCKQCQSNFEITELDQSFYQKIDVPAPTFCPSCRMQRRLTFRNERSIYYRNCDLCKKNFLSVYHPESPYKVYCPKCFYSDNWDQFEAGRDYDASKSFFDQYKDLVLQAPKLGNLESNSVNSEFTNHTADLKDCYLIFAATQSEKCMYGNYINDSKDVIDGLGVRKSELVYEGVDIQDCYNLLYSELCSNCSDSAFLYNCRNCQSCFLCSNLRQKKYCILNTEYPKEEFERKMKELFDGSYSKLLEAIAHFEQLKLNTPRLFMQGSNNENVTGNLLHNCKNCFESFDLQNSEDCSHMWYGSDAKDSKDCYAVYPHTELAYESLAISGFGSRFSYCAWHGTSVEYSLLTLQCKNCFGCTNLHNAEYTILNKKYSKDEYFPLRKKIIDDMKDRGEYGEFFPISLSPYAYNETLANEYFPLSREEAKEKGLLWREKDIKEYAVKEYAFPESIQETSDTILQDILVCHSCEKNYKIMKLELDFYRKMNVPIPKNCHDCRHRVRLQQRNPRKIWERQCQKCSEKIKTSYSPERLEIIYCEKCYLDEVY